MGPPRFRCATLIVITILVTNVIYFNECFLPLYIYIYIYWSERNPLNSSYINFIECEF